METTTDLTALQTSPFQPFDDSVQINDFVKDKLLDSPIAKLAMLKLTQGNTGKWGITSDYKPDYFVQAEGKQVERENLCILPIFKVLGADISKWTFDTKMPVSIDGRQVDERPDAFFNLGHTFFAAEAKFVTSLGKALEDQLITAEKENEKIFMNAMQSDGEVFYESFKKSPKAFISTILYTESIITKPGGIEDYLESTGKTSKSSLDHMKFCLKKYGFYMRTELFEYDLETSSIKKTLINGTLMRSAKIRTVVDKNIGLQLNTIDIDDAYDVIGMHGDGEINAANMREIKPLDDGEAFKESIGFMITSADEVKKGYKKYAGRGSTSIAAIEKYTWIFFDTERGYTLIVSGAMTVRNGAHTTRNGYIAHWFARELYFQLMTGNQTTSINFPSPFKDIAELYPKIIKELKRYFISYLELNTMTREAALEKLLVYLESSPCQVMVDIGTLEDINETTRTSNLSKPQSLNAIAVSEYTQELILLKNEVKKHGYYMDIPSKSCPLYLQGQYPTISFVTVLAILNHIYKTIGDNGEIKQSRTKLSVLDFDANATINLKKSQIEVLDAIYKFRMVNFNRANTNELEKELNAVIDKLESVKNAGGDDLIEKILIEKKEKLELDISSEIIDNSFRWRSPSLKKALDTTFKVIELINKFIAVEENKDLLLEAFPKETPETRLYRIAMLYTAVGLKSAHYDALCESDTLLRAMLKAMVAVQASMKYTDYAEKVILSDVYKGQSLMKMIILKYSDEKSVYVDTKDIIGEQLIKLVNRYYKELNIEH